ncbi:hypothetical protein [Streptomyces sp. NPDC051994]|uniref:hypothetical protein n=1 Tax=Streptomyces sp. NPDC051994 TaxID=3155287 RepID=UPI00344644FB
MNRSVQTGHPRITTKISGGTGRYRAEAHMSGDGPADVPSIPDGGFVRVDVGSGLTMADLPNVLALAHRIRNASVVQIVGRNERALKSARKAFAAAWGIGAPAAPNTDPHGTASRWAAVRLAGSPEAGE